MRRLAAQIEELSAVRFIVIIGVAGGVVQAAPGFFVQANSAPAVFPYVVIGLTTVVVCTSVVLLWWIAVRRRRWSLLSNAAQITLGLGVADLLRTGLSLVIGSIESHGFVASMLAQQPWAFISSNLFVTAIRCPVWFATAAVSVGIGRYLTAPPTAPMSARITG